MILARALADTATVLSLDDAGWTALLCIAHAERLSATLAHRVAGLPIPEGAARVLENARLNAEAGRTRALWEVEMMRRALAPLDVPVVLLKGSAFLAAGLAAGQGRMVGDLDILVPREALPRVEAALLGAGWEWLKQDAYDDHYYRSWMHELPPLIHRMRDAMIDVHHTILPLTARPKPDPAAMIAESLPLSVCPELVEACPERRRRRRRSGLSLSSVVAPEEGQGFDKLSPNGKRVGLHILKPENMVIHAAAHLFADGDLSGGLRNLWDIDRLVREFGDQQDDFFLSLAEDATHHGVDAHVKRALRLSYALFGTPFKSYTAPVSVAYGFQRHDRLYLTRLTARDGWGRETHKLLRFAFYVRSHLIRMPLPLLLRHLWTKWRKGRART